MAGKGALEAVDKVEIVSLVDNCIDHLSVVNRKEVSVVGRWGNSSSLPIAEHGFSMHLTVVSGSRRHSILFDTGASPDVIVTNAQRLGLKLSEVEAVVLSHGHWDHTGGLAAVAKAVGKTDLPILVHEDMFKTRGTALPNGNVRRYRPFPSAEEVKPAKYVVAKEACLLAENLVMVSGEIPHLTGFEKGLPGSRVLVDDQWVPEPWLQDDRALIINLNTKGLMVLSGCGHAGIINTVMQAKQLTGISEVYAVMGGFHLAGKGNEETIYPTVEQLKFIRPKIIAPSHCTGWKGNLAIYQALPEAFVWNSVGNLYRFE